MTGPQEAIAQLEPDVKAWADAYPGTQTTNGLAIMSFAISMKRIADAITGDNQHLGLVDALQQSIEHGIRAGTRS